MQALYLLTAIVLLISFFADWRKSIKGLRYAFARFMRILPDLLLMTVLVALALQWISEETIARYMGIENLWLAAPLSALLGSITLMPGFIAYPLCGWLHQQGVPYLVLGIFSTTLMMVGVVTFPLEQRYLGVKTALLRNFISLVIALIVGLSIGLVYGEFSL